MEKIKKDNLSKFISLILRHKPEIINITLDKHGWADVKQLINGIKSSGKYIDMDLLENIVKNDNKNRYSFNEDKTLIRANQGHSINVDIELKEAIPTTILYHGTSTKFLNSIKKDGLKPMSRLYVHLSSDKDTAIKVGKRHGKPVILYIDTQSMINDGFKFYISENKVWLTKYIPVKYINFDNVF